MNLTFKKTFPVISSNRRKKKRSSSTSPRPPASSTDPDATITDDVPRTALNGSEDPPAEDAAEDSDEDSDEDEASLQQLKEEITLLREQLLVAQV